MEKEPFLKDEEGKEMMEPSPATARAQAPRETRISVEPDGAEIAGPSSRGQGSSDAAVASAGTSMAEAPGDSDPPKDWKSRGILNTVMPKDHTEISRLRRLVDTRLHKAVMKKDRAALRALLKDKGAPASPAALDWEGRTPLHLCVVHKLIDPLKELLIAPGAPDVRDASGMPLLHTALMHRWWEGAHAALDAGARVDTHGPKKIDMFDIAIDQYNPDRYPDVKDLILILDCLPRTAIEVAMNFNMEMFKRILSIAKDRGVVDCLNAEGTTALFSAIWLNNLPAVEALLISGASPHKVSDAGDTALHAAARNPEILEFLLENTNVKGSLNKKGLAPEHIATSINDTESLRLLLDKFGNTRVKTQPDKHTPPHLAAMKKGDETTKVVYKGKLKNTQVENQPEEHTPINEAAMKGGDETAETPTEERTPLDLAATEGGEETAEIQIGRESKNQRVETHPEGQTPLHLAAMRGGDEAAKIILERDDRYRETMFEVNDQGETPLHLAAKYHNREMAALLLLNGANLSTQTKDKNKTTVLELISTNFYNAQNFFELLFDGFIYNMMMLTRPSVHVDYEVLTNGEDMSQIQVLEEFVRCGQSKVLIHPLIESLLYLKWKHFRPLFFALLIIYGIFLVSFNTLMIYIFYSEDTRNHTTTNESLHASNASDAEGASDGEGAGTDGFRGGVFWLFILLTYISIFTLLLQESMLQKRKPKRNLKRQNYFRSLESWVKLSALLLCAATPPLVAFAQGPWPRHVACAALLLAWLQAMFLVSRVSRWGYYVLMFGKVAINILKILATAIFLVIAFASCFMIQYQSVSPFDDPFAAFVKTLVMMSSEFDYEGLFGDNHTAQLKDTTTRVIVRLLFMIFVIFVAIVLMNFMTGVAVSDINDLNETGKVKRLEKQVELLSTFEPLAYDGFLSKWFIKLFGDKRHHTTMYTYRGNQSTWTVKLQKRPSKQANKQTTTECMPEDGSNVPNSNVAKDEEECPLKQVNNQTTIEHMPEEGSNVPNDNVAKDEEKCPLKQGNNQTTIEHMPEEGSDVPNSNIANDEEESIKISSSKLYKAIVETPSKQEQADREAARNNSEKPYRSLKNAVYYKLAQADKPASSDQRDDDVDLINRKMNQFNSIVFKTHLKSLANNSAKMSRDIEELKQCNAALNLQISQLSEISLQILTSIRPNARPFNVNNLNLFSEDWD